MNLLSLDASTKEIGVAVFEKKTKNLLLLDHFTHDPSKSILEKADDFDIYLRGVVATYNIDEVVIEQAFTAMYGGSSSAHTTAILNQMNALYQYVAYRQSLKVHTIGVARCRKSAFPSIKLKAKKLAGGKNHKQQMFEVVIKELGESLFPTKTITKGKRKDQVVFEDFALDMSDAYVVGRGFLNLK